MKSKNGVLFTKLAAIINFVYAGIILFFGLIGIFFFKYYVSSPASVSIVTFVLTIVTMLSGFLLWNAANKMKSNVTVRSGGVWAIVLGVILLVNISGIFAIIGGIFALVDSNR